MTDERSDQPRSDNDWVSLAIGYGIFFILGCVGLAGYFLADGTPATNLIGSAVYVGLVCVFAMVIGAPRLAAAANIPLLIAVAHFFLA